jgi:hypothetical protein
MEIHMSFGCILLAERFSSGKAVVFGGLYLAAESVPGSSRGQITDTLKGRNKTHKTLVKKTLSYSSAT